MRAALCAAVAAIVLTALPARAQGPAQTSTKVRIAAQNRAAEREAKAFWKKVQATCDATAAKPPGELGKRIAETALGEFRSFGGHQIDSNGRLFRFGLTEAEHDADDGGDRPTTLGRLGWWQVMKYWRALYGDKAPAMLEVRGYRDGSTSTDPDHETSALRPSAANLLRAADAVSDPELRETLREAALRGAVIDTPWSAAFISYVVKQAGVAPTAFQFSNAHRAYIYDAFAVSAAEVAGETRDRAYRACPIGTTRPRPGDIICHQREPSHASDNDAVVRELIRKELSGDANARTIRRTHCDVVASVDARSRKLYAIGGNVYEAVTVKKLNLKRGLKFNVSQFSPCTGAANWTLPQSPGETPHTADKCSLNDRNWFVLLQLR